MGQKCCPSQGGDNRLSTATLHRTGRKGTCHHHTGHLQVLLLLLLQGLQLRGHIGWQSRATLSSSHPTGTAAVPHIPALGLVGPGCSSPGEGGDTPHHPRLTFEGAGAGHTVLPAAGASLHQEAALRWLSRPLVRCPPDCRPPLAPGLVPRCHHLQRLGEQAALQLLQPCPEGPSPRPRVLPHLRFPHRTGRAEPLTIHPAQAPTTWTPLLPGQVPPGLAPPGHSFWGYPPMRLRNSAAAAVRTGVSCWHPAGGSMSHLGAAAAGSPGEGAACLPQTPVQPRCPH